jgi:hypothetical protein
MSSDAFVFAGVELSSGRKPVIYAALNQDLEVTALESWSIPEALACLKDLGNAWAAADVPALQRQGQLYAELKMRIPQAGFKTPAARNNSKQWLETDAQASFRALIGRKPLPRRTLEGRLQRASVLYDQGLQITDPMDIFEEITRYRLVQGILPLENLFTSSELDALVAAYVAWLAVNRPGQVISKGEFVLPAQG